MCSVNNMHTECTLACFSNLRNGIWVQRAYITIYLDWLNYISVSSKFANWSSICFVPKIKALKVVRGPRRPGAWSTLKMQTAVWTQTERQWLFLVCLLLFFFVAAGQEWNFRAIFACSGSFVLYWLKFIHKVHKPSTVLSAVEFICLFRDSCTD